MNFITFNIVMLMIKMSFEQINISLEFLVIFLNFLNHLILLDVELRTILEINIVFFSLVYLSQSKAKEYNTINFNITL